MINDLTTLARVKEYLDIASVTHDSLLTNLITSVSAQIKKFCNREFVYNITAPITQYFDTDGEEELFLSDFPLLSTSVQHATLGLITNGIRLQYQSGTWDNITWVDYQKSSYIVDYETGKIIFSSKLPKIKRYIKVIFFGGYTNSISQLPVDLIQIATELVTLNFNNRKSQGISNMSTEGQSVTFNNLSIDKELKNRLIKYIKYN